MLFWPGVRRPREPARRVDVIDHRANLMLVKEDIHPVERRAGRYGDAAEVGLAEDHRHQVERRRLAGQKTDLCDTSSGLCRRNRLIDAVAASHIQQQINASAVSEFQHVLCPLGMSSIVHTSHGAQFLDRLQVFILAGGSDDFCSQRRCDLRGKDRHASKRADVSAVSYRLSVSIA